MSAERRLHPPSDLDVCVIGHVTKDLIRIGQTETAVPGGTAYYTSMALSRFGLRVAVVTKTGKEDKDSLLRDLEGEGINVFCTGSENSAVFENIYSGEDLGHRRQRINAVATPFSAEDVESIAAPVFHVGPLTREDVSVAFLKQLETKSGIVSLDIQGMLRPARTGEVCEEDWLDKEVGLGSVDILKADEKEALVLSGQKLVDKAALVLASYGPREVIITMGSSGSLIYAEATLHRISCCRPTKAEHPTGCGDTYMAGYLYQRMKGVAPELAGRFAAATAALKLENPGPFRGTEKDVWAVLS
jgi:sugar/nucleoside kinase (ribokinase family)